MKPLTAHRWIIVLLGGVLLSASFQPAGEAIEGWLYQALVRLLPEKNSAGSTVVVSLDGPLLQELGAAPGPRPRLANLLHTLNRSGAAAIGWVLPPEPLQAADNEAKTRTGAPPAVLALPLIDPASRRGWLSQPAPEIPDSDHLAVEPTPQDWRWLSPLVRFPRKNYEPLMLPPPRRHTALGGWPVTQAGQRVWAEPLAIAHGDDFLASFALRLAAQSSAPAKRSIAVVPGRGVSVGDTWFPTDAALRLFPYPPANSHAVAVHSASDLLRNASLKGVLKGKTVLVGVTDPGLAAPLLTPGGQRHAPVVWMAHTVSAILERTWVQAPWWNLGIQRGGLILVTLYLLLLPAAMQGRGGWIAGLLAAFLLSNMSLLMLVLKNTWLPFGLPVVMLVLGHTVLAVNHRRTTAMNVLRREASLARCELAANLSAQGQLDKAADALRHCLPETPVLDALYDLGLDFERRRQFQKALEVYDRIAKTRRRYRDIQQRRKQLRSNLESVSLAATTIRTVGNTLIVDDPNLEQPVLGRYRIERELGRGAMGTVYLGQDPRIGRTVAIKTLALSEEFENKQLEEVRRRFYQEAETAGRLNHPNIVTIYDAGEEHDLTYLAMDYIEGEDLDQYIHPDKLLPLEDVFSVGIQVADALDYAHRQNVVHRDVKPGNIIYNREQGRLKVTDFGIACLTDCSKTRTGTVLGSPYYMSPEQIAGNRVDGRSDLFSLGVTLYQLMSGRLPFEGDSLATLMYKIANAKPVPIRKVNNKLPTCVTRLINKALEKDPTRRYASGKEMAETIRRCAERSGVGFRQD